MNIKSYVEKIIENKLVKGTYLFGNYGVGKTHALKTLKTELENHKIYNIEFIVWTDYIVAKKTAMNGDYSDFGFPSRNRLTNAKILFIDDIGGEMPSDWEMREVLFPLLNYRIENKLTTFFTSNFSLTALKEYYEKKCDPVAVGRVIDRIQGLTQQELIEGENWRHKKFIDDDNIKIL